MKIDKEKFNQLKQLDRIEFRQKYNNIHDPYFSLETMIWALIILASLFGTIGLVSSRISFLHIMIGLVKLTFIMIVLDVGLKIILSIFQSKNTKKLEEEYFSVEVKKK
jgi:magnesium-transporting ATPase (P-type)